MRAIPQMSSPRTMPKIPAMTRTAATIHRIVYMKNLYPLGPSGMRAPFSMHPWFAIGVRRRDLHNRSSPTESRPPWETSSTSS